MACGLPVIASDFPSISAIVNDAKCGLLVDPQADLSETVKTIEFWWQNSAIPQSLGEGGRKAILSKYNWENHISTLVKLYRDLS
jgi:glycosyltransferase involved in cell wall biosynthesis